MGLGNVNLIGQNPNEMGDHLPSLDLGLGAVQISAGVDFTCAAAGLNVYNKGPPN